MLKTLWEKIRKWLMPIGVLIFGYAYIRGKTKKVSPVRVSGMSVSDVINRSKKKEAQRAKSDKSAIDNIFNKYP